MLLFLISKSSFLKIFQVNYFVTQIDDFIS